MNLVGKRFGKLVVVSEMERMKNHRRWLCLCDCGKTKAVFQTSLTTGNTRSCGCLIGETAKKTHTVHGENTTNSRLYSIWNGMIDRCRNPNNPRYKDYGGRGIKVFGSWFNYTNFRNWALDNGYSDQLTLDRIDVNGSYTPLNCKWSTAIEQQNNMRSNTFVEFNGERLTLAQWSRKLNIPYRTIVSRWSRGWSVERMLTTPNLKRGELSTKQIL